MAMVDMRRTPKEKEEAVEELIAPSVSDYPYGLCISLCSEELEKLGLSEIGHGEMIHLHCMATVTSVSTHDNSSGSDKRAELQITAIAAEDEDEENREQDRMTPAKRLYKHYN